MKNIECCGSLAWLRALGEPRAALMAVGLLSLLGSGMAQAQANMKPEQEYAKYVDRSRTVSPLSEFGEQVNLRDGSLSVRATDVEIPGIGPTIRITRTYRPFRSNENYRETSGNSFGQWELEIPRIKTITANALGVTSYSPKGWQVNGATDAYRNQRCTNFAAPGRITFVSDAARGWNASEWWDGYHVVDAAGNEQPLMSRNDTSVNPGYPLMTSGNWLLNCLATTTSGEPGEAFYAVAPDGTKYWFNHLVYQQADTLQKPLWTQAPQGLATQTGASTPARGSGTSGPLQPSIVGFEDFLERRYASMLVTRIEDRFHNWVSYNYSAGRLTSIDASDGRHVSLTFDAATGQISSVTVGSGATARTWTYSVAGSSLGVAALTVTLPDHSTWQYSLPILTASALNLGADTGSCTLSVNDYDQFVDGTIKSPAGATLAFKLNRKRFARSYVPKQCWGGDPTTPDTGFAVYPREWYGWALHQKTVTGPGLPTMNWTYAYSPPVSSWYADCATSTSCPSTAWTDVTNPQGNRHRTIFSTKFDETENAVLRDEEYSPAGSLLRAVDHAYATVAAGAANPYPWPAHVGNDKRNRVNPQTSGQWRPERQSVIAQDGVNFTRTVNAFDAYARATDVTRAGPGGSRTETTTYADNTTLWVLGQIGKVVSNGQTMVANTFNSNAQVETVTKFGVLQHTTLYNADGTLASRKDGRNYTTSFSSYKLGIPQSVSYPDGASESATVDDRGWVTSVTNAAGYTTGYGYDAMGRLVSMTPPAGWTGTSLSFVQVPSSEYGLSAGHWKQTVSKGSAITETYFDGLWRPQMTRTYDASDEAGTRKVVVKQYDADGRTTYESYPQRDIASVSSTPAGKTTSYDALGRVLSTVADSELGPLSTSTAYLSGFKTQTTNPRGKISTQGFWALDNPGEAQLASLVAPEGVNVVISRDAFGKPTSIRRYGSARGYSADVTRSYVYDAGQRLCKTVEPEVGATIQAYDEAGNVSWRAPGQGGLTGTGSCDTSSVAAGAKISYGYSPINQLTSVSYGDNSPGITRTYTPDGLLASIASNGASWTYGYNSLRALTSETLSYGGKSYLLGWSYDSNGNLSALTYPDGSTALAYIPNALGEPRQVGGYASGVTFQPNGAVAGYKLGNGIVHSQTQNVRGLPLLNSDGGVLSDQYSYDANGNVTGISDQRVSPADGNASRTMTYDDLDRLITAQASGTWGAASYGYDPVDNIRSATVGSRSSTLNYDGTNRLSSIVTNGSTSNYSYDAQGNIRTKGGQSFTFDLGNRLSAASLGASSYVYDGHGRRVQVRSSDGGTRLQVYGQNGQLLWSERAGTGTVPATLTGYTCSTGTLSGTSCITTSTYAGTLSGYTCTSGGTLSGSTCTKTSTYPATTSYSCPKGGTLSGTTCNVAASSYPAKATYNCPDGGDVSGSSCVRNDDYPAKVTITCPEGGDVSGSNCVRNDDYPATVTYSCTGDDALSGSTCTHITTVLATPVYACPSGYTPSGSTCTLSTSEAAQASYDCSGLGGATAYAGGPGGKACQDQTVAPVTSVSEAMAECMNQYGYAGLSLITAKWKTGKFYTCVFAPIVSYSCPGGGSLSGSQCVTTSTQAATVSGYTCSTGTLSGSSCQTGSSTYAAAAAYSCTKGGTPDGSMCRKTTTYPVSVSYDCPSGGTLDGSMCRKTTTYPATVTYSCPDGGTLSGTTCNVAASSYPATAKSSCSGGGTPVDGQCTTSSSYAATPSYSCNPGDSPSGSMCTHNSTPTAATPVYSCASGTLSGSNCLNATTQVKTAYIYLGGKLIAETVVGGTTQYVHTDALGSPVARTGPAKEEISRTRFEPYGYVAAGAKPSASTSQIGFTGHVQDAETELVYMQQRYYDPVAGRFLSVDPIVTDANTGAGFGLYTYVDNNPYAKIDPDGREPAECSESCTRMRAISDSGSLGISTTSAIESFATGGYGAKFSQSVSAGNYGQAGLNLGAGVAYGLANVATFGEAGAVVGMLKNSANASLPVITKAVNSNLPHAVKRAVERGVFADERAAADGLRALSDGIKNNGLPHGTIWDTARLDRVLVPVGNAGMAVYQIAKNGVAKLKTVLKEISE